MSLHKNSTPRNLLGVAALTVMLGLSGQAYASCDSTSQTDTVSSTEPKAERILDSTASRNEAVKQLVGPFVDCETESLHVAAWWDWVFPRWRA